MVSCHTQKRYYNKLCLFYVEYFTFFPPVPQVYQQDGQHPGLSRRHRPSQRQGSPCWRSAVASHVLSCRLEPKQRAPVGWHRGHKPEWPFHRVNITSFSFSVPTKTLKHGWRSADASWEFPIEHWMLQWFSYQDPCLSDLFVSLILVYIGFGFPHLPPLSTSLTSYSCSHSCFC